MLKQVVGNARKDHKLSRAPMIMVHFLLYLLLPLVSCTTAASQLSNLISRRLGNFDEFNELFKDARIQLPDAEIRQSAPLGSTFSIDLKNLYCENISIGDILINYRRESNQRFVFELEIVGLIIDCESDYDYRWTVFRGDGRMKAYTKDNTAKTTLVFTSPNFQLQPPTASFVESCTSQIDIYNLDFSKGIVARVLDLAERSVKRLLEEQIEKVLCDEFSSLGTTFVEDAMEYARTEVDKYLQPIPPERSDPLSLEKAIDIPPDVTLLNFQDLDNTIGSWVGDLLEQADQYFGALNDNGELEINDLVRELLLEDGRLTLRVEDLPFEAFDPVLFKSHDLLTQTTITLKGVSIGGLDSFTVFQPLQMIGNHTLGANFQWRELTVVMELEVDISPSTSDDSILVDPDMTKRIVEMIEVSTGVDNVRVTGGLFLGIDQTKLGQVLLGSLLRSTDILPCFVSTLHRLEITNLDVRISNIREPILDGFLSPGIDRLVSDAVEAVFLMYEPTFIRAIPGLFQRSVRDLLQVNLLESAVFDPARNSCSQPSLDGTFVDFRDLFLPPEESKALFGSGTEPYGDLAVLLYDQLQKRLIDSEDGIPPINSVLVRPFTKNQSGVEGLLRWPNDLVSIEMDEIRPELLPSLESLGFSLGDLRIANIDTIQSPLDVLRPTLNQWILKNEFNFGPSFQRPLSVAFRSNFFMDTGSSPLGFDDEFEVQLELDSLGIDANLLAKVSSDMMKSLPLRHVLDPYCWASLISVRDLSEKGFPIDRNATSGLGLTLFRTILENMKVNVECLDCTSPGLLNINDILGALDSSGAIELLGSRMSNFVEEVMASDSVATLVDRFLLDSRTRCEVSAEFGRIIDDSLYELPPLGPFTDEAIDTIIYTASLIAEVGFVVFVQNYLSYDIENPRSLLSAQDTFDYPSDITLIDWTNLTDVAGLGQLPETLIDGVREFLSRSDSDGILEVNSLIRDFLSDGKVTIDLKDDASWLFDDLNITMTEVRIQGLDSFTELDIFTAIGPQTLLINASTGAIHAELDIEFDSISTADEPRAFTLSIGVGSSSITGSILAAIDADKLGAITLGSLLDTQSAIKCLLSSFYHIEIPRLEFDIFELEAPAFTGMMDDTDRAVRDSVTKLLESYEEDIIAALPIIVDTTIKEIINSWLSMELKDSTCQSIATEKVPRFLDLRDLLLEAEEAIEYGGSGTSFGDLLRLAKSALETKILNIDPDTGLSAINGFIIDSLTKSQSGTEGRLEFEGDLFQQNTNIAVGGLRADVTFRAYDTYIDNLNTVGAPLSLLDPVNGEPYILNNTASIGVQAPLKIGTKFEFEIIGDDGTINNNLDISLDLDTLTLILSFLLKISSDSLLNFPVKAMAHLDCWLNLIPDSPLDRFGVRESSVSKNVGIETLDLLVKRIGLNVSCIECSGPAMSEWTQLLATPEAQEDVSLVASKIFRYATSLVEGSFLQVYVDRRVSEARRRCEFSPMYDPSFAKAEYDPFPFEEEDPSIKYFVLVGIVGGALAVLVLIVTIAVKMIVRRRNLRWIKTLPEAKLMRVFERQREQDLKEARMNASSDSMFSSSHIPIWIRLFMPLVILGNIALFLSGHLSLGGTVSIEAQVADEVLKVDSFFEFSIAKSTVEIWNAGGTELAIMILIFSVIWPYTKQIITFVLWFLPPSRCSISKRGSILLWLDALAKWSMIDIFTLVITIAGFRISINSPDVAFLPPDFYSIDLLVVPLWGLYANMIAQLVSQISSHVIIHYHRRIQFATSKAIESENAWEQNPAPILSNVSSPETLKDHAFARPHRGETERLVSRKWVNSMLSFIALATTSLVIVGCVVPSFSLEVLGLIGVFVESGQQFNQARTEHSLFTIVGMLFDQADFTGRTQDYVGLGTLSMLLLLTVLIVPIIQTLMLLLQWFYPLCHRRRFRLSVFIEMLQAWQYAEVYLLALLVASWQLGQISDFMINSYCESLDGFFGSLVFYGIIEEQDAQCFRVESRIESASYFLASAALLLAFMNTFVMKAVSQYFRDKELESEGGHIFHDISQPPKSDSSVNEIQNSISPVATLFTDRFRWFMRGLHGSSMRKIPVPEEVETIESDIIVGEPEPGKYKDSIADPGEDPANFLGDVEESSTPGSSATDDSST